MNDDIPMLSVNDVSEKEGDSGSTLFMFTVSSALPAPAGGITFDIATHDNTATAASDDYVARSLTGQSIPAGQQSYTLSVIVNGDTLVESDESFFVNISNVSGGSVSRGQGVGTILNDDAANLVISQLYGGGGNSGAAYKNDFVEIFNRDNTTIDFAVTNYSLQNASSTSNFGSTGSANKFDLTSGRIGPHQYFLVQLAGGTSGVDLPTADATGSISMAATTGKIALVRGTTAADTEQWTACSESARRMRTMFCSAGENIAMMRLMVDCASAVCRVEISRWPVSAAFIAVSIVSASRISPIMMTSGSCRSADFNPCLKSEVSDPISR